jgi:Glycosyl hydrolase family 81 C-terminal domain
MIPIWEAWSQKMAFSIRMPTLEMVVTMITIFTMASWSDGALRLRLSSLTVSFASQNAGYLLHACATLGSLDPSFVDKYANSCDAIFYDIAHNSNFEAKPAAGPFFPGARHLSWFDAHSFASGMFPFGNGKSQESSSEAVNGYFGAYLWSVVRNGAIDDPSKDESPQTDFARLLLSMEIQGARMYWQMSPEANPSPVKDEAVSPYTTQFRQNYMVGNLGMLDALCSTWFGDSELYVHMINFLPVTAATALLFQPDYAAQEYDKKLRPLGEVEMAWRGYVIADQAIVDPNGLEQNPSLFLDIYTTWLQCIGTYLRSLASRETLESRPWRKRGIQGLLHKSACLRKDKVGGRLLPDIEWNLPGLLFAARWESLSMWKAASGDF